MNPMFLNRKHTRTLFVQLDTQKCKACWICIKNCPSQIINKLDLPWHKHALIVKPDACTGCLSCINICQHDAYSITDGPRQETEKQNKQIFNKFLINNLLLFFGLVMILSGLALQVGFHMATPHDHHTGTHEVQFHSMQYEQLRQIDTDKIVYGFNYHAWSTIHKFAIVFFSLFIIYHTYIHWKWYEGVITKHLIKKNRQVLILSVLFIFVAVTGLVPWFIDLSGNTSILRIILIEIHDKLALLLIFFLVLHIIKRVKWFTAAYIKLKK